MTLSIGALAQLGGHYRIVATFDMMIGTHTAASEVEYKCAHLPGGLFAMYAADDVGEALDLLGTFHNHLKRELFDWSTIRETLLVPLNQYLRKRASAYVERRLKIPFDQFMNEGEELIEPELRRQTQWEVASIRCGIDLIVCGFDGVRPWLFEGFK